LSSHFCLHLLIELILSLPLLSQNTILVDHFAHKQLRLLFLSPFSQITSHTGSRPGIFALPSPSYFCLPLSSTHKHTPNPLREGGFLISHCVWIWLRCFQTLIVLIVLCRHTLSSPCVVCNHPLSSPYSHPHCVLRHFYSIMKDDRRVRLHYGEPMGLNRMSITDSTLIEI
ncbi:hypothetical protein V8G54_023047, partial [Vigna mungo]